MSSTSQQSLFPLKVSLQNYEWGKKGSESLVARLAPNAVGDFKIDENEYYAELWMGTHSNGPAHLMDQPGTSLHSLISSAPSSHLGRSLTNKFPNSTHIPFLFKILSMAKALPLQAHPDKALGEQLHARNSEEFVDDNHKPEMALAVTDGFRGFVGFRPAQEIAKFIDAIPELKEAIGDEQAIATFLEKPTKEGIPPLFSGLLSHPQNTITPIVERLVARVKQEGGAALGGTGEVYDDLAQVVIKVQEQYPGDVGLLAAVFFMNLVTLKKGEAVYIGADEVHAYLEGDIIECMAISDNVVNAGFVPPAERDIKTFTSMLTYTSRPASTYALPRRPYVKSAKGKTTVYDPPLEEFSVLWTELAGGEADELEAVDGPGIAISAKGSVTVAVKGGKAESVLLKEGGIVYVKSGTAVTVQSEREGADVYWAVCDA